MQAGKSLSDSPLHLGLGATASSLTKISDMEWYQKYAQGTKSDGDEGRLVSMYSFSESWGVWEMHPVGEECVICTVGEVTTVQDIDGKHVTLLKAGEYVVNPKGVWHTADCRSPCTVMFIPPGRGTQNKPRDPVAPPL